MKTVEKSGEKPVSPRAKTSPLLRKRMCEQCEMGPGSVAIPNSGVQLVSQISARFGIPQSRVSTAMAAFKTFSDEDFGLVIRLVNLHGTGMADEQCRELSKGLQEAFDELVKTPVVDPLQGVDDPMSSSEALESLVRSSKEINQSRAALLEASLSALEASRIVQRSRQNLEALRRSNKALALRVRSQWRYPAWQFEVDQPGGIVRGLAEVLHGLHLSPFGAALWLTQPCSQLQKKRPIDVLKEGRADEVVRIAETIGYLP